MPSTVEEIARAVLRRLERARNLADGEAFAEPFTKDADFVDLRGDPHRGQDTIAGGHQASFHNTLVGPRS